MCIVNEEKHFYAKKKIFILDIIKRIKDPEFDNSLEELKVVSIKDIIIESIKLIIPMILLISIIAFKQEKTII